MSAPNRTLFPCAPFKGDSVAASNDSTSQSTPIQENQTGYEQHDHDLSPLDTTLPSPPLMSTTGRELESPTTEANKDEGQEVKSETGSDIVMSPSWGVLLISPRHCGPIDDETDTEQLWSDATYGIRGHTYLADSPADPTAEASFSWEKFFAAIRDNTLPNLDLVGAHQ
ncbi:hypothetical protein GSI_12621 [Ganoderma sinense ZZ0214-1]|uniref:Uncharacterized protein n=1 Tax=Ganoderma sinense ZZ0214-1 TaxID=1077348 RepID=A0A2G8RT90_9APHY|nr:hypothetical protein GSI_12621 [Ganoderma sinense ZZ0214-1]